MRAFKIFRFAGHEKPAVTSGGLPDPCGSINVEKDTTNMSAIPLFSKATESHIAEGRVLFGPGLAASVLHDMIYSGQRRVRPAHVADLASAMRRKAFAAGGQIAFARVGRQLLLINGQHRLHAIVESGRSIEFQVLIVDCKNNQEVARHYYSFDRLTTARSDSDVLSAVGITDKWAVSKSMARAVWQGAPLIDNNFERFSYHVDHCRRDDDHRLTLCAPWWEHAVVLDGILAEAPAAVRKRLLNAQSVAVAMVILRDQPKEARAFLSGLAGDDGLRRDDPRKALLIDMMGRTWRKQGLDGVLTMAYAWNAFFMRRPLSQLKVLQNSRFRLEGTEFDGRR